jgi:hypothetical protein
MRFAALRSFAAYEVGSVLRPCCISGLKVRFDRHVTPNECTGTYHALYAGLVYPAIIKPSLAVLCDSHGLSLTPALLVIL